MLCGSYRVANPKVQCMKRDKCSKRFLKIYKESTVFDENAFFYYRHRKRPDSSFLKTGIALLHEQ